MGNKKDRYEVVDVFAQIAIGGGKKLKTRIPRMQEVQPISIEHCALPTAEKQDVQVPVRSLEEEYQNFVVEKKALKERYRPFLCNYARTVSTPIVKKQLKDFAYRKETEADRKNFFGVLQGRGNWERVTLPHYVGPEGKWNAFYVATLRIGTLQRDKEYAIDFEAVDYAAEVYLNGRLVAQHTGFFAPFSAIVTPYLKEGDNTLLVVVKNDVPTFGAPVDGKRQFGNKIYAATGLGYDDPDLGWHHCPAGAGIFGKVFFVECNRQRITDIYVQPNIDDGTVRVHTTFYNFVQAACTRKVRYTIEGRNFKETVAENVKGKINEVFIEENYLDETFTIPNCRLWTPSEPYLYAVTVTLLDENDCVVDEKQTHFGMRKFAMDENSTPKGKFYLNNERIVLRGANEMGHFSRAVMEDDYEQVVDDILTAKEAGLNFYRFTQRPVLDDIYTYFDMMGMLCQTDFPLFCFLRESVVGDAVKQVDEMERLTRNHPCVVVESFCNETADSEDYHWEQYGLGRMQMEEFFEAARRIVRLNNPDRVVKYCDGDYSAVEHSYGINDFHCYTYWYSGHGMPAGKFDKGYLPPIRQEWMTGCGEYGVDGLDYYKLMKKYYPKQWLPKTDDEPWTPKRIKKAQCFSNHSQFFPEQTTIEAWIEESQKYQREAITAYVHALRRRIDYVQSSAVHLLIDAWPAGWTKALVGVDRIPKPAYYAFKEANLPVRISIRKDKYTVYADDEVRVETFGLNDTTANVHANVTVSVYFGGELQATYAKDGEIEGISSTYLGDVIVCPNGFVGNVRVVAKMTENGRDTYATLAFDSVAVNDKATKTPLVYGEKLAELTTLCSGNVDENVVFCDNVEYRNRQDELEAKIVNGGRVVVFTDRPIRVFDEDILFKIHNVTDEIDTCRMAWHSESDPVVAEFAPMAFNNIYNAEYDYQDLLAWFHFNWEGSNELLYTLEDSDPDERCMHKKHVMVMASKRYGKGELVLSTVSALKGCIGRNPYLDKLLINLIEKSL